MPSVTVITTKTLDQQVSLGQRTALMGELQSTVRERLGFVDVEVIWKPPLVEELDSLPLTVYVEYSVNLLGLILGIRKRRKLLEDLITLLSSTNTLPPKIYVGAWIRPILGGRFKEVKR